MQASGLLMLVYNIHGSQQFGNETWDLEYYGDLRNVSTKSTDPKTQFVSLLVFLLSCFC